MKRRRLGWVIVVLLAAVFVRLGFWQIDRLHQRQAGNQEIETNLASPAAPLTDILSEGGDPEYRHATVTGQYDPEHEVLLRNRSYEGQPGFHVLTPLRTSPETTVLIDRGWVPLSVGGPPVEPPPPDGTVEVTGVIRPGATQPSGIGPKDPPSGVLTAVFWPDPTRLASQMPGRLEPVYLELRSQVPAGTEGQPLPSSDPVLTNGPHLSYAVQWFAFALIALIGYWILMRRSARSGNPTESQP